MIKVKLFQGHVLEVLKRIESNSIDCIITSPPYWGLRKYPDAANIQWNDGWCGQLGLEPTLEMYIEHLLQITAELKRVLKPTGVMFWNHGDSYIGSLQGYGIKDPNYKPTGFQDPRTHKQYVSHYQRPPLADYKGLPQKCMALQNYRLILSMLDDLRKWELRDDLTEEEKEYVIKELIKYGVLK